MWELLGEKKPICEIGVWPEYDEKKLVDTSKIIPVQVNGKRRGTIKVAVGLDEAAVRAEAEKDEKIAAALQGKTVVKVIYIKDKMLNIVVK